MMEVLGKKLICQQKMERDGVEKNLEYNAILRFIFGDMVEALTILVMKSAKIDIESEQEKVDLQLGKNSISGTLDVEIDGKVADGDQAIILDQVENGVAVRMAVLYLLSGSGETI